MHDEQIKTEMRGADVLARRLYRLGCRYAFGMPGGEVLAVIDALERAGIRFVLCHHENAAGFMAEGAHHQDGAPAILVATLGPGVLNGVNVIANAHQDRVPLIVLSGCVDAHEAVSYTHQVLDHSAVLAPITKASYRLNGPAVNDIADKALAVAMQGRQGPVHIDVPMSVADMIVQETPARPVARAKLVPAPADAEQIASWLEAAQRPIMIVGLDVLADGSAFAVAQFAHQFGCPVVTSYKAKGVLCETDALALGGAGLSPAVDQLLVPAIQSADLIICVGYDPIEMRAGWRNIWDAHKVRVVDISAEANRHFMHHATLSVIGDTGATLEAISAQAAQMQQSEAACVNSSKNDSQPWSAQELAQLKANVRQIYEDEGTASWGPAAVIETCRRVMPKTTIATADSGAHRIVASQMWTCFEPKGLLQSSGLCTMGCALPLAMGAKLASPERPVIAFMGDAGFLMVAGELATAVELGVAPIFVVFVDRSLSLIELKQRQRQMPNLGVDFAQHDYAQIARSFGGHGVSVDHVDALEEALKTAQNASSFTLIAAQIDRKMYDGLI